MTKTTDSYPLIRTTSVCFTGAGEQKGKVMKQQIIKISLKALQMLFKAKTVRYKVKKHGTWYDLNKKNVCNLDYKQWFH